MLFDVTMVMGATGKDRKQKHYVLITRQCLSSLYSARANLLYSLIHAAGLSALSALCVCVYICPCVLPFVIDLLMTMGAAHD